MLNPGDAAPSFTLPDHTGAERSLDDLLGRGRLVLYFYPADFTPACTAQACGVRDMHEEMASAGVAVAGVSPQSVESHRKFAEKYKLPFTLLADPKKEAIGAYGAKGPFGLITRRVTYLIERADGGPVIVDRVLADLDVGKHRGFVRRAVSTE